MNDETEKYQNSPEKHINIDINKMRQIIEMENSSYELYETICWSGVEQEIVEKVLVFSLFIKIA